MNKKKDATCSDILYVESVSYGLLLDEGLRDFVVFLDDVKT
jgi:hypothetical protein